MELLDVSKHEHVWAWLSKCKTEMVGYEEENGCKASKNKEWIRNALAWILCQRCSPKRLTKYIYFIFNKEFMLSGRGNVAFQDFFKCMALNAPGKYFSNGHAELRWGFLSFVLGSTRPEAPFLTFIPWCISIVNDLHRANVRRSSGIFRDVAIISGRLSDCSWKGAPLAWMRFAYCQKIQKICPWWMEFDRGNTHDPRSLNHQSHWLPQPVDTPACFPLLKTSLSALRGPPHRRMIEFIILHFESPLRSKLCQWRVFDSSMIFFIYSGKQGATRMTRRFGQPNTASRCSPSLQIRFFWVHATPGLFAFPHF